MNKNNITSFETIKYFPNLTNLNIPGCYALSGTLDLTTMEDLEKVNLSGSKANVSLKPSDKFNTNEMAATITSTVKYRVPKNATTYADNLVKLGSPETITINASNAQVNQNSVAILDISRLNTLSLTDFGYNNFSTQMGTKQERLAAGLRFLTKILRRINGLKYNNLITPISIYGISNYTDYLNSQDKYYEWKTYLETSTIGLLYQAPDLTGKTQSEINSILNSYDPDTETNKLDLGHKNTALTILNGDSDESDKAEARKIIAFYNAVQLYWANKLVDRGLFYVKDNILWKNNLLYPLRTNCNIIKILPVKSYTQTTIASVTSGTPLYINITPTSKFNGLDITSSEFTPSEDGTLTGINGYYELDTNQDWSYIVAASPVVQSYSFGTIILKPELFSTSLDNTISVNLRRLPLTQEAANFQSKSIVVNQYKLHGDDTE